MMGVVVVVAASVTDCDGDLDDGDHGDNVHCCHAFVGGLFFHKKSCLTEAFRLLLARAVDFVPTLPEGKIKAISALGYGLLNKVRFYCTFLLSCF